MSNWGLNSSAPSSLDQQFDAAATPQVEQYWGSLDLMLPIPAVVNSGVASAVGSAAAAAAGSVVRKGTAPVNAAATLTVNSEQRFKGSVSISCQATSTVGLEVVFKGVASGSASAVTSGSAKQVNKGLATVQAMSTVVAIGTQTEADIVLSLGDLVGVSTPKSVLRGWFDTEPMGAMQVSATASVFQAEVVANTAAAPRGASVKVGSAGIRKFKSIWRDEMPEDEETKKRRAALNANDLS